MALGRQKIGDAHIDRKLCGGLTKGRVTVVRGPRGVGIQHLGVSFALKQRGIILDLSPNPAEFDHAAVSYAQRGWRPRQFARNSDRGPSEYLHIYQCLSKPVTGTKVTPDEYQQLCRKVVRNRLWIARFLHDNLSRGIKRLTIDGINTLATNFGHAQRSLLTRILTEFVHVAPEDLANAADLTGPSSEFRPRDIGVVLVVETSAQYAGTLKKQNQVEWDSSISDEQLPVSLEMKVSEKWQPLDWSTQLRLGRIRGHSDFILSIPDHNLSSHNPSPNRYHLDTETHTFRFKPWFRRTKA